MATVAPQLAVRLLRTPCRRQPARRPGTALRELAVARPYGFVQAKLKVGAVNHPLEQEADAAADRVMRMKSARVSLSSDPTLSRTCAACETEEKEENPLRRRAAGEDMDGAVAPPIVHDVLRSPGRPLDSATRDFMAPRFGADFGDVRIHTDATAARSAAAVAARAYTVGRDVVFGSSQYRPDQPEGQRLIAHELAHVTQQEPDTVRNMPLLQREVEEELDQAQQESEPEEGADEAHDGDSPVTASATTAEPAAEETIASLDDERSFGDDAAPRQAQVQPSDMAEALDNAEQEDPKLGATKKAGDRTITTIDVDQVAQSMTLTWSDGSTEAHVVSTGRGCPNTKGDPCKHQTEERCTPNGEFKPGKKGNGNHTNQKGDAMAWYVEFVEGRGIGIHDSQRATGDPLSHGCVRVGHTEKDKAFAEKINKNVDKNTTIKVHGKAKTSAWRDSNPKNWCKNKKK